MLDGMLSSLEQLVSVFSGIGSIPEAPIGRRALLKAGLLASLGLASATVEAGTKKPLNPKSTISKSASSSAAQPQIFTPEEETAYQHLKQALSSQNMPTELASLFMAQIKAESQFNPNAESKNGALGYLQIKPETGKERDYTAQDLLDPLKNLQAGTSYMYDNIQRFAGFEGEDKKGEHTIDPDEAVNYSLVAHNLGPSALERLLQKGYGHETAGEFITHLKERVKKKQPIKWRNPYKGGRKETIGVEKLQEVIGYYEAIAADTKVYADKIASYEKGPAETAEVSEEQEEVEVKRPVFKTVKGERCLEVTVISGDTLWTLANDYTKSGKNHASLQRFNPDAVKLGGNAYIPVNLLRADLRGEEEFEIAYLDAEHPSVFAIAKAFTAAPKDLRAPVMKNSRVLLRASGILDPTAMDGSDPIYIPPRILKPGVSLEERVEPGAVPTPSPSPTPEVTPSPIPSPTPEATPTPVPSPTPETIPTPSPTPSPVKPGKFRIDMAYATRGKSRKPWAGYFNWRLKNVLQAENKLSENTRDRSIDTIVYHTTESGNGTATGVLEGVRKKKSAHYVVAQDGRVYQVVDPKDMARGAGKSVWKGIHGQDFNSVNIEICASTEAKPLSQITQAQYTALKALTAYLRREHPTISRFLGHNQIAVGYAWDLSKSGRDKPWESFVKNVLGFRQRKGDPGRDFSWQNVGLSDSYQILDPDILAGRVQNNPSDGAYRRLPGQVRAAGQAR